MEKINFPKLLGKLDLLDGLKDRQYYGISLLNGPNAAGQVQKSTTGACSAQNGEGIVAFWDERGERMYDCQVLARQLSELVDLQVKNPVSRILAAGELSPEGVGAIDSDWDQYHLLQQATTRLLTAQIGLKPTLPELLAQISGGLLTISFSEEEAQSSVITPGSEIKTPKVN